MKYCVGEGEVVFSWRGKVFIEKIEKFNDFAVCDLLYFIESVRWMVGFI